MKVLRIVVATTKIDRIRSQQIREFRGPINEWVERRRREWGEHITRMNAERIYLPEDLKNVLKEDGAT